MNTRQRKKHLKKQLKRLGADKNHIYIDGNKGGDFVEITKLTDDTIYLNSACSCVSTVDCVVPNEFLSMLLAECLIKHGSVENFIMQTDYADEYKVELMGKIKRPDY